MLPEGKVNKKKHISRPKPEKSHYYECASHSVRSYIHARETLGHGGLNIRMYQHSKTFQ